MYTVCRNLCIQQAAMIQQITTMYSFGAHVECKPKINTIFVCESFVSVGCYLLGKMQNASLTELKGGSE
jgi:hypothetical protein